MRDTNTSKLQLAASEIKYPFSQKSTLASAKHKEVSD